MVAFTDLPDQILMNILEQCWQGSGTQEKIKLEAVCKRFKRLCYPFWKFVHNWQVLKTDFDGISAARQKIRFEVMAKHCEGVHWHSIGIFVVNILAESDGRIVGQLACHFPYAPNRNTGILLCDAHGSRCSTWPVGVLTGASLRKLPVPPAAPEQGYNTKRALHALVLHFEEAASSYFVLFYREYGNFYAPWWTNKADIMDHKQLEQDGYMLIKTLDRMKADCYFQPEIGWKILKKDAKISQFHETVKYDMKNIPERCFTVPLRIRAWNYWLKVHISPAFARPIMEPPKNVSRETAQFLTQSYKGVQVFSAKEAQPVGIENVRENAWEPWQKFINSLAAVPRVNMHNSRLTEVAQIAGRFACLARRWSPHVIHSDAAVSVNARFLFHRTNKLEDAFRTTLRVAFIRDVDSKLLADHGLEKAADTRGFYWPLGKCTGDYVGSESAVLEKWRTLPKENVQSAFWKVACPAFGHFHVLMRYLTTNGWPCVHLDVDFVTKVPMFYIGPIYKVNFPLFDQLLSDLAALNISISGEAGDGHMEDAGNGDQFVIDHFNEMEILGVPAAAAGDHQLQDAPNLMNGHASDED